MPEGTAGYGSFFAAWELFRDPALAGTLAGALLGMLGVYVVLRRMVFLSAALAQTAGLGATGALVVQSWGVSAALASPGAGAMLATLAAAAAMLAGRSNLAARRDGVLGWVYLVGAAGTLVLGTRIGQELHDLEAILFGSAVAVLPEDFLTIVEVTAVVGLAHLGLHRGFVQVALDPDGARVRRLPVLELEIALVVSLAVAVSACTRVLGALPVFAFTVLPAMAALRLASNVPRALVIAAVIGAVCGFAGYVVAFVHELPVGASQALVAALAVALAALPGLVGGRARRG